MTADDALEPIAIVGMAGRFPGAATVGEFWANQRDGVESLTRYEPAELLAAGVDPRSVADPDFVPVSGGIAGADLFDAEFFGFSPSEAALLDPQHRLFLECAWEALEDAGHDPDRFAGAIGVYAGSFMNKYLPLNLYTNERFMNSSAVYFARNYNDKDFLAGRAAYLFNLSGPAVTVQTACSTSLVATHLACQALLNFDCDAALVGGVAVNVPLKSGYPKVDGGLLAPDGHCRPFDARAGGTVPGFGSAVVMLRRLSDAVADRDDIRAVIRGTAVNNDGSDKVSFTAPSVKAQAQVIATAQAVAGVDADTIGYLEAHGTATPMGDPIEVAALTEAFRVSTAKTGFCALGSVKANIGHLDAAAGAAGLLRATLALQHKTLPPLRNFQAPNPQCKLEDSPFYVPTTATAWAAGNSPRRAGVSSFGVGGTNAHVVLEEAPTLVRSPAAARRWQLLPLSARTQPALSAAAGLLSARLTDDVELADVAYTLQEGRRRFDRRTYVVAGHPSEAAQTLLVAGRGRTVPADRGRVVFSFPGGGSQHPDMALEIYQHEPVFAAEVDRCAEILRPLLRLDLRGFLFPSVFAAVDRDHPTVVLAGIFAIEYALARLWMSWGVEPSALLGHSLGEYAAACLAGVFQLPDALDLTVRRGELFAQMPAGRMLSVALGESDIRPLLGDRLSIAALNAPELTLVSGPRTDIEALAARLATDDVECRLVHIEVASHSWMVEPYLPDFQAAVGKYQLSPPDRPVLSGVTGRWLTAAEATDPGYWARHLRQPVRFADCVREATATPGAVLLEVGPGHTLTSLVGAQRLAPPPLAIASLPHPREPQPDLKFLLGALGRLWQAGVEPDWDAVHGDARPHRLPLPTYPFQRRRHWISPGKVELSAPAEEEISSEPDDDGFEPAVGAYESAVAGLWQELLGLPRIDRFDDFAALGGHSLLAAQFVKRLSADHDFSVNVREVFAHPTVAELGGLLARRADGVVVERATVDLEAEAILDPDIQPTATGRTGPLQAVLLTGATGFLGAFLCAELLAQTDAVVHCLVRAADPEAGRDRILARMAESGLPGDADRIVAVPGDLAAPRLGLSTTEFEALAHRIDAVYHCGAWVNFVRPYPALKPANVGGTKEILRLAAKSGIPVHHVSTLAVLAGGIVGGADRLPEDGELPPPVGHDTAYSESKWVAEKLVHLAAARGLPVSVYRPGVVLGDSRTGVSNVDDYMTAMVTGCVRLGLAPLRHYPQSVATVDDVARVIVALSLHTPANGRVFHPLDPRPLPWNELFEHVRAAGYRVQSVPFDQWRDALARRLEAGDSNALEPLADNLSAATGDRRMPVFGTENVTAGVPAGLARPALDAGYFRTVLQYFARCGWLPPAPRGSEAPDDH
ncbi:type I polyketide synthase [Fodinicola feengrottensis]|uniref:Acyltransferase domain-containing protein n=1 Tax=Fodinicola feengrottensis TaxID=435914 RepID=A0ABN2H578_9ACTN|nr:type I polyketide synthase [Fodinicola feengrottensis]